MKKTLFCSLLLAQSLVAVIARKDVPQDDCWNLAAMYATPEHWQSELDALVPSQIPPYFPQVSLHKGALGTSPQNLHETLSTYFSLERKLDKLYTYANLRYSEDVSESLNKSALDKINQIFQRFQQEASWINPELFSLSETTFLEYINHPELAEYKIALERLLKEKPHVLSSSSEEILAQATTLLKISSNTFAALNNADIKFNPILDSEGTPHELTHGSYLHHLASDDRILRKNAFFEMASKYSEHENTLAELYAGTVKGHHFIAQARRYNSCLEASLSQNNIDVEVYTSLIQAVRSRVDLLHRYLKLKKQILNFEELHPYDLFVPLVSCDTKNYTFQEAVELVIEAVKPLGPNYQQMVKNGLVNEHWVDRYENQGKKSGGFSSGCFDSMPYILMNFTGQLQDVFTLVHETGHSMHTLLSCGHQPYHTAGYSIFVAEVASIFNEELLRQMLLSRATTKKERLYLLNRAIEDIQSTLFRQVLLAEFELFAHNAIEQNIALTPKLLKDKFLELNQYYSGPDLIIDPENAMSWARVPHFHNNFYVYQYATGQAAALGLATDVLKGDENAIQRYFDFLKAGASEYPLEILSKAGCDLRTSVPVHKALDQFEAYLNEFEQLMIEEAAQ